MVFDQSLDETTNKHVQVEDDGKGWVWLAAEMSPGGSVEVVTGYDWCELIEGHGV